MQFSDNPPLLRFRFSVLPSNFDKTHVAAVLQIKKVTKCSNTTKYNLDIKHPFGVAIVNVCLQSVVCHTPVDLFLCDRQINK